VEDVAVKTSRPAARRIASETPISMPSMSVSELTMASTSCATMSPQSTRSVRPLEKA
jgi:hypothetical protein